MFFDPKIDYAFKRVFATAAGKKRLCSLLNSFLKLTGKNEIKSLEVKNGEALSGTPLGKLAIFDVHCEDKNGHKFIVEMQNRSYPDLHKRAGMYVARCYADQLKKGKNYKELKPVVLIAFLSEPSNQIPYGSDIIRSHLITEQETGNILMHDMKWYYAYIGNFRKKESELSNLLEHWFYFLTQAPLLSKPPKSAPPEVADAYHEMEQSTWSDAARLAYDESILAMMDDESKQTDSFNKGKVEGKVEGKAEGELMERIRIAKSMKASGVDNKIITDTTKLSLKEIQDL